MLVLIVLTGCISFKSDGGSQKVSYGPFGIYKSIDGAVSWQTINSISNAEGKKLTLAGVTVSKIIFDPSDNETIYLTTNSGLFHSLDAGKSWQRDELFNKAGVTDVTINHSDKCTVYITAGQSIYKTDDCMRTWQEVYFDKSRADLIFTDVETENYNANIIYAANNYGDILKSVDHGKTWKVIKRLGNRIIKILIDKDDTRIVYFATSKRGLFRTTDGGTTWSNDSKDTDINESMSEFKDAKIGYDFVQDKTRNNSFIYISKNGLLRTNDGGANWEKISLLSPPKDGIIYSIAIDPKDTNRIFYGTANTLYKSVDAGVNWSTQNSPSNGVVDYLIFDPKDSKIIYMGMRTVTKK